MVSYPHASYGEAIIFCSKHSRNAEQRRMEHRQRNKMHSKIFYARAQRENIATNVLGEVKCLRMIHCFSLSGLLLCVKTFANWKHYRIVGVRKYPPHGIYCANSLRYRSAYKHCFFPLDIFPCILQNIVNFVQHILPMTIWLI